MPASERALRATDVYRGKLRLLRDHAQGAIRNTWPTVTLDDLDATHAAWVERIAPALTEMQRAAARLSGGYLAAYLTVELHRAIAPTGAAATAPAGTSRAGKPLPDALATSLYTVKAAIRDGQDPEGALRAGVDRAARNSAEDVVYIARAVLARAISDRPDVHGWRRVTGGGCGACLASATGAVQHPAAVLRVHDGCSCTQEPVVAGVRETIHRPTGRQIFDALPAAEQDQLLGPDKARLVRDGEVSFHDLVERQPMAAIPDGIVERPLEALVHH